MATSPGSKKWPPSVWRDLLREAIALFDTLPQEPDWTVVGGTALFQHYGHRVSYDIEVLVRTPGILASLSPAQSQATRALLSGRSHQHAEHAGSRLKLYLNGGEIDIRVGRHFTACPEWPMNFEGRGVSFETPWESAIKRIAGRPSQVKARDVFDLAAVVDHHPKDLRSALPEVEGWRDKHDRLVTRIERLAPGYAGSVVYEINPLERGGKYMEASAAQSVLAFLKNLRAVPHTARRWIH